MAITKLMHMKEGKTRAGAHLKNSIDYILDVKHDGAKTGYGLWVGGNSGTESPEIFQTMLDTKADWQKPGGRQGYHFVISFLPGEVDEAKAFQVVQEFCESYLGNHYDYVFAIHNDQDHLHGHIVFNSVCRTTGYKYRYEKGDWEKKIQPITDRVCKKHDINPLVYDPEEKKGRSYVEQMTEKNGKPNQKKIIQGDIDYAIAISETYEDFLEQMKSFGYRTRTWYSQKHHRDCLTFYPPKPLQARRDYILGPGYFLPDIQRRIKLKTERKQIMHSPGIKKRIVQKNLRAKSVNRYQVVPVQRLFRSQWYHSLNPYRLDAYQVRKDHLQAERLAEQCRYLLQNQIKDTDQLRHRKTELLEEERLLKGTRSTAYANLDREEQRAAEEYQTLAAQLQKTPEWEDAFEEIQNRMEELEVSHPEAVLYSRTPDRANQRMQEIRKERRIINRILKETAITQVSLEKSKEQTGKHGGKEAVYGSTTRHEGPARQR